MWRAGLADGQTGRVEWHHWETLPPPGEQGARGDLRRPVSPYLVKVEIRPSASTKPPPEDDLGLKLRPPLAEPPISEPERPQKDDRKRRTVGMVGDRRMDGPRQLTLEGFDTPGQRHDPTLSAVAAAFDPARLTQARRLADLTKTALADLLDVSAVAVGQWEAGTHPPGRIMSGCWRST